MKRTILLLSTLLALSLAAGAADPSGQWLAQIPGRDGNPMDTTFKLKASAEKLTGSVENQFGEREISEGKVSGDDISFNVHLEFGGNQVTFVYTGKLAGSEIKFKRERKGGELGPPSVEFVAKRKS